MPAVKQLSVAILAALLCSGVFIQTARAEQKLIELDDFPFSLAVQPGLRAELLPVTDPAGFAAAAVFPRNITEFDVLALRPAKGTAPLKLIVGRTTGKFGGPYEPMRTQLAFTSGDDTKAQLVGDKTTVFPGIMNRICVWVDSATGGTVVLFSLANGSDSDGPVYGYVFGAGAPHALGMAAARAVYGGFEVSDLNGDGRYELITARNLDGMAGGFNYHAVRAFNGTDYATDPDRFKDYFQRELDFLNWVVATRDEIQADPEKYMRRPKQQQEKLVGYAYVATYGKESYGFDTLVELPPDAAAAKLDTSKYNQLRREAYRRVTTYRDQLQSWLAGGAHPAVWGLPR